MRRLALVLSVAVLPALLSACGSNCRALNELLCRCNNETTTEIQQCYGQIRQLEGQLEPTAEQQEVCGQLLETCKCEGLDTAEGKRACGLAN